MIPLRGGQTLGHRRIFQWVCWIAILGWNPVVSVGSTGAVRDITVHVWICRSTAPPDVPIWTRETAPRVQPVLEFFRLSGLAHTVVAVDHAAFPLDRRPATVWLACPYARLPRRARARLHYWITRGTTLWVTADMWADTLSPDIQVDRRVPFRVTRVLGAGVLGGRPIRFTAARGEGPWPGPYRAPGVDRSGNVASPT